jgi:hypothetical protein
MVQPLMQICIPSDGVGFIIEYRVTRDQTEDIENSDGVLIEWRNRPVQPAGHGWFIVRSHSDNSTLWRRIVPWVGRLSRYAR